MKRFWVSWIQTSSDYRPLQDPPQPASIKAWWCSGQDSEGNATLCAIVDDKAEYNALDGIAQAWSEKDGDIQGFRFIEEKPLDWLPNDRFPITKDWEKERLGGLDA